jgi:hypothetical protein
VSAPEGPPSDRGWAGVVMVVHHFERAQRDPCHRLRRAHGPGGPRHLRGRRSGRGAARRGGRLQPREQAGLRKDGPCAIVCGLAAIGDRV